MSAQDSSNGGRAKGKIKPSGFSHLCFHTESQTFQRPRYVTVCLCTVAIFVSEDPLVLGEALRCISATRSLRPRRKVVCVAYSALSAACSSKPVYKLHHMWWSLASYMEASCMHEYARFGSETCMLGPAHAWPCILGPACLALHAWLSAHVRLRRAARACGGSRHLPSRYPPSRIVGDVVTRPALPNRQGWLGG